MPWLNLTATAQSRSLEELESWFWENGAVSVTVEDAGDDPIYEPRPAETPAWGKALVTGLFEDGAPVESLAGDLLAAGFGMVAARPLADRQWEREWLKRFKPMRFGERLWICPTGCELDPAGRVVVRLDPGLAFGTGTHETTRLCLEYVDSANLRSRSVIDYGCGSGVLAIAAALVGATDVHGVDTDPQAIAASRMNADRNGVTARFGLAGEVDLPAADLVIANILARPLVDLSARLCSLVAPGGALVLSGIMRDQAAWVKGVYRRELRCVDETANGDWARLVFNNDQAG